MKPTKGGGPAEDDNRSEHRVFVDAIDDDVARLLDTNGEDAFDLPARLLPHGVAEGDWIALSVRRSSAPKDGGESAVARRKRLVADDPGGPIKL